MADLIHEAHAAINRIEKNEHKPPLSAADEIAAAQVKVLIFIAQLLDERLPRPDPPGAYKPQ